MIKDDYGQCWERWKEVKEKVTLRRKEIYTINTIEINQELDLISELMAYSNPFIALETIKVVRGNVLTYPLDRENKVVFLTLLNEMYKRSIGIGWSMI